MKPKLAIYDIETTPIPKNGIAYIDTIWAIGVKLDNGPVKKYTKYYIEGTDGTLKQALEEINKAEFRTGHNIIGFDDYLIEKLIGPLTNKPLDTLILSKIMFSKDMLYDIDFSLGEKYPKELIGAYSLKAFGHRMGKNLKIEFNDFSKLSTEMIKYMEGDINVSKDLIDFLQQHPKYPSEAVIEIEHKAAAIITKQSIVGFHINIEKARELNTKLLKEKLQLANELSKIFKPKFLPDGPEQSTNKLIKRKVWLLDKNYKDKWKTIKKWNIPLKTFKSGKFKFPPKTKTKWHDIPKRLIITEKMGMFQNIKYTKFNPGSRQHIVKWLRDDIGYKFPYYTPKGNIKVDVDSLTNMEHPAGKMLVRYLKVSKDQSQVGGAEGSFLKNLREDTSTVTSKVDTNGTVTGRFTSSKINLNQIPAQAEFRELFTAPKGWTFIGTDFSGQENINLAEMLYSYDNGRLDKIIASGDKEKGTDLHSLNAKACKVSRSDAKPLWFGFLYGSSTTLTGYTLLGNKEFKNYTEKEFIDTKKKLLKRVIKIENNQFYPIKKDALVPFNDHLVIQAIFGAQVQANLISSTIGLKELIKDITAKGKENGYVTMFGGRIVPVRHAHATLNSQLQGMGAEAMKHYLVFYNEELQRKGLIHGKDYKQQATIYDEVDLIVKDEHVETVAKVLQETYAKVSTHLGMTCKYTGEVLIAPKNANNWQSCH